MATSVVLNNVTYSIPAVGDSAWGPSLSAYLIAIASGVLSKSGGSFTLTADTNFGPNFGLISPYFVSSANGAASAGVLRLANSQYLNWRNAGSTADIGVTVDSSNNFLFGSNINLNGNSLLNSIIVSPTLVSPTFTGPISVSDVTFSGTVTFDSNPTILSSGSSKLFIESSTNNQTKAVVLVDTNGSPTNKSWIFGSEINANNQFEITPSVTAGAQDFSNPALTIQSTGAVAILGSLTIAGTTQLNGGTNVGAGQAINLFGSSSGSVTVAATATGGNLNVIGGLNASSTINANGGLKTPVGALVQLNGSTGGAAFSINNASGVGTQLVDVGIAGVSNGLLISTDNSNNIDYMFNSGPGNSPVFEIKDSTSSITMGYPLTMAAGLDINMKGSSSGTVSIAATSGTYNFNLPTTAGTSGQLLASGGGSSSPMTWISSVAIANGGTGQTTANAGFNALSPLTTKGDVLGFSTVNARISVGADGQVLTADSTQTLGVKWANQNAPTKPTVSIATTTSHSGAFPTTNPSTGGAGTYTTPAGVLYLRVRMAGGGGGGCGSAGTIAGTGGTSTFGTSLMTCTGGGGGNTNLGGTGGSANSLSPAVDTGSFTGGSGSSSMTLGLSVGGAGGTNTFAAGTGATVSNSIASATVQNTGAGGAGGGGNSGNSGGGGGGAGGYASAIIYPTAGETFSYSVGVGSNGTNGVSGNNGAAGAGGVIIVEEYYQ